MDLNILKKNHTHFLDLNGVVSDLRFLFYFGLLQILFPSLFLAMSLSQQLELMIAGKV